MHAAGALLFVDGVHLTPHAPVGVRDLGADFYACSPYKFFGPHLGVLAADPALLELVHPDKLLPSTDAVPERFELGTLPYELLAGVTAAVDFIADLASGRPSSAGAGCWSRCSAVEAYEDVLFERLLVGPRRDPRRSAATAAPPGARRRCCSRSRAATAGRCTSGSRRRA